MLLKHQCLGQRGLQARHYQTTTLSGSSMSLRNPLSAMGNLSRLMNKQWTYSPCGVEQDFQITGQPVARGEIRSSGECVRLVLTSKSQEQLPCFDKCHDQAMLS